MTPRIALLAELKSQNNSPYIFKASSKYSIPISELENMITEGVLSASNITTPDGIQTKKISITQSGIDELNTFVADRIQKNRLPASSLRYIELKAKAKNKTITQEEKQEALDLFLSQ